MKLKNLTMNSNLNTILKDINVFLQEDINKVKNKMSNCVGKELNLISDIYNYISNHQGKLIRPILTILSAKLFNYDGDDHIKLASAIELIHTATLLHDDVIDESKMRRSYNTVNRVWSNKAAILMGDYLFSKSFQLMVETNKIKVLDILSYSSSVISKGEIHQLENIGNLNITQNDYIKIISAKTAYLFRAATHVGALVATNNNAYINSLANFGYNMGLAFQIIDDVNDYIANKVINGKNAGDDLNENKITLPLIIAMKEASEYDNNVIKNILLKETKQNEDLEEILDILLKYNCLEKSKTIAYNYVTETKKQLTTIPSSISKDLLINLLISIIN